MFQKKISMTKTIGFYSNSKDNNFNLIRFVAAALVLYSHSFAIVLGGGQYEPLRNFGISWGEIAVDVFFVTSGYLITQSYLRSNILSFISKRILRIYPALIFATFLTVIVLTDDLLNPITLKFIFKNITLFFGIEYSLPGVFENTPYKEHINGSLWTLPWEVRGYALLSIVALFKPKYTLPIVAIIGLSARFTLEPKSIHLLAMFFVGAAIYMWRDFIVLSTRMFLILSALVVLSTFNNEIFFIVYSLSIPYLVFYIAYIPTGKVRGFNNIGDYSYGLYIYAFPVQQILTYYTKNLPSHIALSFCITLCLAFFSWHLIEKKCLKIRVEKILFLRRVFRA